LWCINLQIRDLLPDLDLCSAVTVKATFATEVLEGLLRTTVAVTMPAPRHVLSTETKGQTGKW
jgi:hypothetical protein